MRIGRTVDLRYRTFNWGYYDNEVAALQLEKRQYMFANEQRRYAYSLSYTSAAQAQEHDSVLTSAAAFGASSA